MVLVMDGSGTTFAVLKRPAEKILHESVLSRESLEGLSLKPGNIFVDATLNGGGHSERACEFLGGRGTIVGIDLDHDAIVQARTRLAGLPCSVHLLEGNYRKLDELLTKVEIGKVDGVLFDLGLSSAQLEASGRGFSFLRDEPLLMTFWKDPGARDLTARDILNSWREDQIADVIYGYGEERFARRIATQIVERRVRTPFEKTTDLVEAIRSAVPWWYRKKRIHFATRTFQALRIAVNDELGALREGLEKARGRLVSGGRLAVISFHSIEDRIVKRFMSEMNRAGSGVILTKKPITPSREEMRRNPRSRSAKLRIFEKA